MKLDTHRLSNLYPTLMALGLSFLALDQWCPSSAEAAPPARPRSGQGNALQRLGLVDVTAAPYGADSSGARDSTEAIRRAMAAARKQKAAVFFPVGTYQVSDTLESALDMRLVRKRQDSGCMLLGSHAGPQRPKIVLVANAPGFNRPAAPKPVIYFWSRGRGNPNQPQPNINYHQVVLNLDIEVGPGNPGAVAIDHDGAQGSGIEDVTITLHDGFAGIVGLQAGGGGTHNVTVRGGRFGIDASQSRATAATVSGVTLIGQGQSAIRYNGLETLSLVGARIVVPAAAQGPAIEGVGSGPTKGTMSIVDTQIEFDPPRADGVAVGSNRSVYLGNVWVRGAGVLGRTADGTELRAREPGWNHVVQYAHGVQPPRMTADKQGVQLAHVCYIDGRRTTDDVIAFGPPGNEPPEDLQSRHVWPAPVGWGTPGLVSVKSAPYNAQGNGTADDTAAIQRAIDENDVVLLPKGYYAVSRTLTLRPDTMLIGLRDRSVLLATQSRGGDFNDPQNPQPLVRSADSAEGRAALVYVGLAARDEIPATLLHWRTGGNSVVRSIFVGTNQKYKRRPVLISDHGGGRWYSLFKGARLAVEGTTQPLRFYQANPEWGNQPHMVFRNADNVTIYGLKEEGPRSIYIVDCDHFNLYGYGGNASAGPGKSLIQVERTPNFRLVGLVDRVNVEGAPPSKWHMLSEIPPTGPEIQTRPLDRIVLYQRGEP